MLDRATALAGRAAPSSHIGATRFGQEIPRLRQAGEHRIDVGSQDLRDLRVTHAGENREKQDLAMVERERIEPQDLLRQERKRGARSSRPPLPGNGWRAPCRCLNLLNRISDPKHQEISAGPRFGLSVRIARTTVSCTRSSAA